jgi:hypothetical protein
VATCHSRSPAKDSCSSGCIEGPPHAPAGRHSAPSESRFPDEGKPSPIPAEAAAGGEGDDAGGRREAGAELPPPPSLPSRAEWPPLSECRSPRRAAGLAGAVDGGRWVAPAPCAGAEWRWLDGGEMPLADEVSQQEGVVGVPGPRVKSSKSAAGRRLRRAVSFGDVTSRCGTGCASIACGDVMACARAAPRWCETETWRGCALS